MNQTFTIESEVETRFCALLTDAVDLWKCGEFQASLDLLAEVEPLVEFVSDERRGKFHNTRALALQNLGEHDRAVIEFSGAAFHFEACGDTSLQAIVFNNASRSYSLLGDHDLAHESVDKAISLLTDPAMLGQSRDQKARIFLDDGKPESAEIESRIAVELLQQVGDSDSLAEALTTHGIALVLCENKTAARVEFGRLTLVRDGRSMVKGPAPSSSPQPPPQRKERLMPSLALTHERSEELIHALTANNDASHAWEIIELLEKVGHPNDNIAEQMKRQLYFLTPEFEADYLRQMQQRFRPPPVEEQSDSEN